MPLKDRKYIRELRLEVENISPLHIGADEGEILIDKEENKAYIPGTTLAGAFRAYLKQNNYENVGGLFGENNNISNVFLYDSFATLKGMKIRPNVRIDSALGVAEKGGKFERNFIGEGHKFILDIEVFSNSKEQHEEYKEVVYNCIGALNSGTITLGAYKSSGAGLFKVIKIEEKNINLEDKKQLFSYLKDEIKYMPIAIDVIKRNSLDNSNITFLLKGTLQTALLIKGDDQMDANKPDGEQMKNYKGEFIIPGSSLKGVIRAQGEKILDYHKKKNLSSLIFGSLDDEKKIASKVKAFDTIIEAPKKSKYNRIKIDKFTGGVIKGALMDDEPIIGNIDLKCKLKYSKESGTEKISVALISLIFRDIALGNLSLGSGYNIGRGRVKGISLVISKGKEIIYEYDFNNNKVKIDELKEYFEALNKEVN